jgi:hypothetical protein
MSGLLDSARLPRARQSWPRLELRASLRRRRQLEAEREYRRIVAGRYAPR